MQNNVIRGLIIICRRHRSRRRRQVRRTGIRQKLRCRRIVSGINRRGTARNRFNLNGHHLDKRARSGLGVKRPTRQGESVGIQVESESGKRRCMERSVERGGGGVGLRYLVGQSISHPYLKFRPVSFIIYELLDLI